MADLKIVKDEIKDTDDGFIQTLYFSDGKKVQVDDEGNVLTKYTSDKRVDMISQYNEEHYEDEDTGVDEDEKEKDDRLDPDRLTDIVAKAQDELFTIIKDEFHININDDENEDDDEEEGKNSYVSFTIYTIFFDFVMYLDLYCLERLGTISNNSSDDGSSYSSAYDINNDLYHMIINRTVMGVAKFPEIEKEQIADFVTNNSAMSHERYLTLAEFFMLCRFTSIFYFRFKSIIGYLIENGENWVEISQDLYINSCHQIVKYYLEERNDPRVSALFEETGKQEYMQELLDDLPKGDFNKSLPGIVNKAVKLSEKLPQQDIIDLWKQDLMFILQESRLSDDVSQKAAMLKNEISYSVDEDDNKRIVLLYQCKTIATAMTTAMEDEDYYLEIWLAIYQEAKKQLGL